MNEERMEVFFHTGLSVEVSDSEFVVRFLKDSNQYNAKSVKHQAFSPRQNSKTGRWEVSVFRYRGESKEFWKERNQEISSKTTYHGFAKLNVGKIRSINLEVEADDTPPAHANIIGWQTLEDKTLNKSLQMSLSQKLANFSEKILYS